MIIWHIPIGATKKRKKKELIELSGVSKSTLAKMTHDEHVSTEMLLKICQALKCDIGDEMLNSEEKGLVSSQYCMLYRDIMVKVGDKLSDLEKSILKAVLIINMGIVFLLF